MTLSDFTISLRVGAEKTFAGPLDLLLHLIEKEELPITAVSVRQVIDQFLAYLAQMPERRPEPIADFLEMAARLLYIKSLALLPQAPKPTDEDEEVDPAEALARQLREYKQFKVKAEFLQTLEAAGRRAYVRMTMPPTGAKKLDPEGLNVQALVQAVIAVLQNEELPPLPNGVITPHTITIEDRMAALVEALAREKAVLFHRFLGQAASRLEIIVSLLAVLELLKQGRIRVEQPVPFGEIRIEMVTS
ncbi:MAG: ScpA family protein [Anaerolineae bacterium]|nr:segregation/condensation protein A [Caldilineales bacterium]MDW8267726.1 ScpA family protein [Anaerolineae bacterium]